MELHFSQTGINRSSDVKERPYPSFTVSELPEHSKSPIALCTKMRELWHFQQTDPALTDLMLDRIRNWHKNLPLPNHHIRNCSTLYESQDPIISLGYGLPHCNKNNSTVLSIPWKRPTRFTWQERQAISSNWYGRHVRMNGKLAIWPETDCMQKLNDRYEL
jgi:hypothetical protein